MLPHREYRRLRFLKIIAKSFELNSHPLSLFLMVLKHHSEQKYLLRFCLMPSAIPIAHRQSYFLPQVRPK